MKIDIAIIDSGIHADHPHVRGEVEGLSFNTDVNGTVLINDDFSDRIGHGTAIAGIIREKSSTAKLYALKIFHDSLTACSHVLIDALCWAVDRKIKLIHLSLGTENRSIKDDLEFICQTAVHENLVIIAAARSPDDMIYPAVFNTTIGVFWDRSCDESMTTYHVAKPIEFGAYGYPRPLPGLSQNQNFKGHSFAAARITARVAHILSTHPNATFYDIKTILIAQCCSICSYQNV